MPAKYSLKVCTIALQTWESVNGAMFPLVWLLNSSLGMQGQLVLKSVDHA